jgi:predicted flap endonuclease-1-like 5' DNA nuclease
MAFGDPLGILAAILVVAALLLAAFLLLRRRGAPGRPPAGEAQTDAVAAAPAPEVPSPFLAAPDGPPDDLRQIKGIGPKLEARLRELGVFHFRQIAGWTPEQLALVDRELGQFQGRPERDQWQSQARYLAAGDVKGYEAAHGRLGPGS